MAVKYALPLIAVLGLALVVWYFGMATPAPSSISSVTIGTTTVAVEVADTDASRELGLSNRGSLPPGRGMLFVFERADTYGFWMKDMNFPLDMLFADAEGKIVTIDSGVSPDSYKKTPPEVFYPRSPVTYVLEVPAGFAKEHGIVEGSAMELK